MNAVRAYIRIKEERQYKRMKATSTAKAEAPAFITVNGRIAEIKLRFFARGSYCRGGESDLSFSLSSVMCVCGMANK